MIEPDRIEPENHTVDHDAFRQWLDLDLDGSTGADLGRHERELLGEHLASCRECAVDARLTHDLHAALAHSQIDVRSGFRDGVMAALPAAPWAATPATGSWRLPAAAAAAFLALATGVLLLAGDAGPAGALSGAVAAVGDLFATTLLAGAGLLAASWKGTGLVVQQTLSQSTGSLAAMVILVVSLNVLLFSLIRRRRTAVAEASPPDRR